jgi:hypothetical protein
MDAVGTDNKITLVDRPIFRGYRATDGGALNADGSCGQPNPTLVWVVLVKDLKQLLSVEKGYGESEPIQTFRDSVSDATQYLRNQRSQTSRSPV